MKSRQDRLIAIAMITPSLILLAVFVYGFIGQTLYVSMSDWGRQAALALDPDISFIGLDNFRELFTGLLDVRFRQDLVNMLAFSVLFVAGCLLMGLVLATLLEQGIRGEGFFRTVFLFPMSLSFIVTGTIWRWMLQPRGGVNVLPTLVGLPRIEFAWLTSRDQVWQWNWQDVPQILGILAAVTCLVLAARWWLTGGRTKAVVAGVLAAAALVWTFTVAVRIEVLPFPEYHGFNLALIGIVVAAVWQMSGYTMALFLAGLRGIPDELREAARVDGCSWWQMYRYVELPLLKPIIWSAVIILGHIALKAFDLVFVMAGPDNAATSVPAISMYLTTFRGNQFGKGAAIAVVLLVLVSLLIIPYLVSTFRSRGEA
ncbi:MAG: sugar ABC transporter permease [Limnochordales bacterium]|jgi:ABC-type sugar transport systems, permease components|nr:glucose transporter [Bacillota bacterium]